MKQFKSQYKEIVTKLIEFRKESNSTHDDIAKLLGVTRKKIIHFESNESIDIELLFLYCEKYSIELTLKHKTLK